MWDDYNETLFIVRIILLGIIVITGGYLLRDNYTVKMIGPYCTVRKQTNIWTGQQETASKKKDGSPVLFRPGQNTCEDKL